jgi:hypothetical protein|nr:MAG TPA: apolipoprotein [Caudoviricetes sp.]
MKNGNGYYLSDFSVDIFEEREYVKIRLECFADNRVDIPFRVGATSMIDADCKRDEKFFYSVLSRTVSDMINNVITSDIVQPDPCECQARGWFRVHPDDRQEYWRTREGRIYPKSHTVKCPNNPSNRIKSGKQ